MNKSVYSGFLNDGFNSGDCPREKPKGNVEITRVPFQNSIIVLMNHPSSITVYNHVGVEVLSGSVSVLGYEIEPNSPSLNVYSSEKTGLIEVKTENFDRIWKKKAQTTTLEYIMRTILRSDRKAKEVMGKFGNSTVAILLKTVVFPKKFMFLDLYFPNFLKLKIKDSKNRVVLHVSDYYQKTPIHFGINEEKIAAEINGLIRSASVNEVDSPRIIVYGPKNTGKSTFIRFLINKIISEHTDVCHLETDTGQCEFTPPGLFSLTKLTEPVMGPPMYNRQKPVSMIFSGSISPTSPAVCINALQKLMGLYSKDFKDKPLLVNTIGWMEGMGLECLVDVIKIVKPNVLVEIVHQEEISMFDYREYMPADGNYYQICCSHNTKNNYFSPKELREMSLVSYFSGPKDTEVYRPVTLSHNKPVCVSWNRIPLYSYHQKVLPSRMIETILGSIVALCSVPNSTILESNIPLFPKTLKENPVCECVGYGLVSAVSEEKQLMYIIAPLMKEEWRKVNAIIKGHVLAPDCFYKVQDCYNVPIPHADVREIISSANADEDMECSMISLADFFSTPVGALDTSSYLGQSIGKRYKRTQ